MNCQPDIDKIYLYANPVFITQSYFSVPKKY